MAGTAAASPDRSQPGVECDASSRGDPESRRNVGRTRGHARIRCGGVHRAGECVGRLGEARHRSQRALRRQRIRRVKYLSWAQNLTWYERAHERGLDEVILLNERGEVCECTSANIFALQGSTIFTPPLSSGCLPGVTRAVLLEEIHTDIQVVEKTLFPKDLEKADELFISSTTRELMPVAMVEGLELRGGHEVIDRLQAVFTEHVKAYVAPRRRQVTVT